MVIGQEMTGLETETAHVQLPTRGSKEELLEVAKKTKIKTFLIGESLLKNSEKNPIFSVL